MTSSGFWLIWIHLCFVFQQIVQRSQPASGFTSGSRALGRSWHTVLSRHWTFDLPTLQWQAVFIFVSKWVFSQNFSSIEEGLAATISKWLNLHIHNHFILIKIAATSLKDKHTREETLTNFQPRAAGRPESRWQKPDHQHNSITPGKETF